MEDTGSGTTGGGPEESHATDLSTLVSLLQQQLAGTTTAQSNQHKNYQPVTISLKLDDFNYSIWCRMMRMAIGGRGCLSHITGTPAPPPTGDPGYTRWEQEDLNVQSDIIHNIGAELVPMFIEYQTAKELWDGLSATYSSGRDYLQIFDLKNQANSKKQGDGTIEAYYGLLQRIWREIDRWEPNPMTSSADIATYNRLKQEDRLFQFRRSERNSTNGSPANRRNCLCHHPARNLRTDYYEWGRAPFGGGERARRERPISQRPSAPRHWEVFN